MDSQMMTFEDAKRIAITWTHGVDVSNEGWRAVMAVLLNKCLGQEEDLKSLRVLCHRLQNENEKLSLDLGFKNENFTLPQAAIAPLIQAAKIVTEINNEYARKVLDKPAPGEEFK